MVHKNFVNMFTNVREHFAGEPYRQLLMTIKCLLVVRSSNDSHEVIIYCHKLVPGRSPL